MNQSPLLWQEFTHRYGGQFTPSQGETFINLISLIPCDTFPFLFWFQASQLPESVFFLFYFLFFSQFTFLFDIKNLFNLLNLMKQLKMRIINCINLFSKRIMLQYSIRDEYRSVGMRVFCIFEEPTTVSYLCTGSARKSTSTTRRSLNYSKSILSDYDTFLSRTVQACFLLVLRHRYTI